MIKLKNVSASRAMRMHVSGQLVVAGGPAEEGVPGGIACRWSLSSSLSLNFMFDLGDEGEQVARAIRRSALADKKRNGECQLRELSCSCSDQRVGGAEGDRGVSCVVKK